MREKGKLLVVIVFSIPMRGNEVDVRVVINAAVVGVFDPHEG